MFLMQNLHHVVITTFTIDDNLRLLVVILIMYCSTTNSKVNLCNFSNQKTKPEYNKQQSFSKCLINNNYSLHSGILVTMSLVATLNCILSLLFSDYSCIIKPLKD